MNFLIEAIDKNLNKYELSFTVPIVMFVEISING